MLLHKTDALQFGCSELFDKLLMLTAIAEVVGFQ
jgi:hypothetical protein